MIRCVCGHPASTHQHYRNGTDCGDCGRWVCPRYVALNRRDSDALTPAQRVALAESDAHVYRNLSLLADYARAHPERPRIPAQRRRSPEDTTVRGYLTARRARGRRIAARRRTTEGERS